MRNLRNEVRRIVQEELRVKRSGRIAESRKPLRKTGNSSLDKFLSMFSDKADSWMGATDEISDAALHARYLLRDIDEVDYEIEPSVYKLRRNSTPAEHNYHFKRYIVSAYSKMSPYAKEEFLNFIKEMFLSV